LKEDLGTDVDVFDNFNLLKNRVGRLVINALVELSQIDKMNLSELSIPKLVNDCIEMIDDRTNIEFHIIVKWL
jgi:hypothetical protein